MQFRKKPVLVDAVQYTPGLEDGYACYETGGRFVGYCAINFPHHPGLIRKPTISAAFETREVSDGDWVVTHASGWRSVCSPEEFAQKYELADGPPHEDEAHELIRGQHEQMHSFAKVRTLNADDVLVAGKCGSYANGMLYVLNALGIKIEGVNADVND